MLGRKKYITILELDNQWLKVVQAGLSAKDKKIHKIIVESTASCSDERISEMIKNVLKQTEISPELLVISVPHQLAAIRNLELPSLNPEEIKDMVQLQVGKQTPFTKEEIIFDYGTLSTNAEGYTRVMLAIVHQDAVRWYFKILESVRLSCERIALSSEGLLRWSHFAHPHRQEDKPLALIDVNYDKSDFSVVSKNQLIFCRNISVGASQAQNNLNEWQEKFIEEINHSIYAYQNEMVDKEIGKIIITGAKAATENLNKDSLKNVFNTPVEIFSQLHNVPEALDSLDSFEAAAKELSLACLFGLALGFSEQKLNFIPQELKIEKGVRQKGKELFLFGIYLIFILVLACSVFLGKLFNKERYANMLQQELLKVQDKVNRLDRMGQQIDVIKRRALTRHSLLNFIYEVHRVSSPDICFSSLSFGTKDVLSLRGTSNNMPAVIELRQNLEQSDYFQDVETKFATTRKEGGQELTDFEIVCPLSARFRESLARNQ